MKSSMFVGLLVSTVCCVSGVAAEPVKIGIPESIFRDVPKALLKFAGAPLRELVKAQTGFDGDVVNDSEAMNIARDIDAGKVQLGVFLGHEFAWAKKRYPKLEPLVVAVPKQKEIRAFILVRHDNKAAHLGEMKGSKLAMSSSTRDHCKLFLDKRRSDEMAGADFTILEKSATIHDAVQQVIDGSADLTCVDQASWAYFKVLNPGQSQNLRVLAESEIFPPTVIAYRQGTMPADQVDKFQKGMLTAHENEKGKRLMSTIKMERFDALPKNYAESLNATLKLYPVPPLDRVRR